MGNTASDAARAEADKADGKVQQRLQLLRNKLQVMELEIEKTRGPAGAALMNEVGGGRTVMRMSEIRVATEGGVDGQIKAALGSFFEAAQGSAAEDNGVATKQSAIAGAQALVTAGIDALFGVQSEQAMKKQSFVVLFLNNTFVRVDYYIYTYSISAKAWGAAASESGCCYVTDLAVLDMADLTASEVDFLISQALSIKSSEFGKLMEMKVSLMEVAVLSRALKRPDLSFKTLREIAMQLASADKKIDEVFKTFNDADPKPVEN